MDEKLFGVMLREASSQYETAVRTHFAGGKPSNRKARQRLTRKIQEDLLGAVRETIDRHEIPWGERKACRSRLCSELGKGDAVARWLQPELPFAATT